MNQFKTTQQRVLYKVATKDKAIDLLKNTANSAKKWITDPETLQDLGMGALTGAGTYVLSGLLPKAEKKRKERIIASLLTGATAAAFGPQIRKYAADHSGVTEARLNRELAELRKQRAEYKSPADKAIGWLKKHDPVENSRRTWDKFTDKISDTLYGSKERSKRDAAILEEQKQILELKKRTRG